MPEGKIAYKEKCIIEAESREGKSYVREISLLAQEVYRKPVDKSQIIFLGVELRMKRMQHCWIDSKLA